MLTHRTTIAYVTNMYRLPGKSISCELQIDYLVVTKLLCAVLVVLEQVLVPRETETHENTLKRVYHKKEAESNSSTDMG